MIKHVFQVTVSYDSREGEIKGTIAEFTVVRKTFRFRELANRGEIIKKLSFEKCFAGSKQDTGNSFYSIMKDASYSTYKLLTIWRPS